jgi:hypothetical protein
MHTTKPPQRWQFRKAFTKTLHPAPFLIDGDKECRVAARAYAVSQRSYLYAAREISAKKNDTAYQRMPQYFRFIRLQFQARKIDH